MRARSVVLQRTRDDLGGGGAEAGGQDDQRASPTRDIEVTIGEHIGAAVGVAHLHDGADGDEEPGDAHGFAEQAATIHAKVENDALCPCGS